MCIGRFLREYLGVGDFIDDSGLEPEDIDSCKATFIAPPELVEFAGYALQGNYIPLEFIIPKKNCANLIIISSSYKTPSK